MSDSESFTEGMRAYRKGQYAQATRWLRELAEHDDLMGRLARFYCAMSHRALGIEQVESRQWEAGIAHLRRAIALVGNKSDLVEYLLAAYARTGQHQRCAEQADVLAELNPADVAAHIRLAQSQWRTGRQPLAIMTLTAAIRRLGDHAELHLHLGLFHAADDQYELARVHLEKAAECDGASVRAFRYLGLTYAALGQFHKAAGALARALALAPQDALTAFQLCQVADAAGRAGRPLTLPLPEPIRPPAPSQVRQLAEYVAGEPDFMAAFLSLPESSADGELFEVVVSVLRTAVAIHPEYADLHHLTSLALVRLGDQVGAVEHARQAVRINPRYAQALVNLAGLEQRAGLRLEAIASLRAAIDAGADWPDVHAQVAEVLKECGMTSDSANHFRRALELNRRYERASAGLTALAA